MIERVISKTGVIRNVKELRNDAGGRAEGIR